MAFREARSVQFPRGIGYAGPTAVLEFEFSFIFPSGLVGGSAVGELEFYLKLGMFAVTVIPTIQADYLAYTIEVDTAPRVDRYRVKVFVAGDTETRSGSIGPLFRANPAKYPSVFITGGALLAIVFAIGVAGLFAVIAYRIYNLGPAGIVALGLGTFAIAAIAGAAIFLILGGRRRREAT